MDLYNAIKDDKLKLVKELIDNGADVNFKFDMNVIEPDFDAYIIDEIHLAPGEVTAGFCYEDQANATIEYSILGWTLSREKIWAAKMLIEAGADINHFVYKLERGGRNGHCICCWECREGHKHTELSTYYNKCRCKEYIEYTIADCLSQELQTIFLSTGAKIPEKWKIPDDLDFMPTDKQIVDIPVGHVLYKKYYFHKAHEHMEDFGVRVECLLKAEEYDVVSRIVAEKCGLPFGEKLEIRSVADAMNFVTSCFRSNPLKDFS